MMSKSSMLPLVMMLCAAVAGALCIKFSVNIGDARKAENFARDGWFIGSIDNLKESFGGTPE